MFEGTFGTVILVLTVCCCVLMVFVVLQRNSPPKYKFHLTPTETPDKTMWEFTHALKKSDHVVVAGIFDENQDRHCVVELSKSPSLLSEKFIYTLTVYFEGLFPDKSTCVTVHEETIDKAWSLIEEAVEKQNAGELKDVSTGPALVRYLKQRFQTLNPIDPDSNLFSAPDRCHLCCLTFDAGAELRITLEKDGYGECYFCPRCGRKLEPISSSNL